MNITSFLIQRLRQPGLAAIIALLGVAGPAGAATINFNGAGGAGGGYGNTLQFSGGGITVDAYAWADTGALQTSTPTNWYYFQTAEVWSWSTGLGICNRLEGQNGVSCDTNEHEIDTAGTRDDLLVLHFDQLVNFENLQVTVDPWDGPGSDPNDRDIRFWIATVGAAPNLSPYSFDTLGGTFGASTLSTAPSSYNSYTHLLNVGGGPVAGNLLMITGNFANRSCTASNIEGDSECEAWKLSSIVVTPVDQVIPVPAAVWLLGSALGGLAWLRRRATR
jgi:hypothetical protein